MSNDQEFNANIASIFDMASNRKITQEGLEAFKAIIQNKEAFQQFLADTSKTIIFFDALHHIDKDLFTQALSVDHAIDDLAVDNEQAQWIVDRLDTLEDEQVIQILCSYRAVWGLASNNQGQWIVDRLDKFKDDEQVIQVLLGRLDVLCATSDKKIAQWIVDKLDTFTNEQVTQLLSADYSISDLVIKGQIEWMVKKLSTLTDEQFTQALSADYAIKQLIANDPAQWLVDRLDKLKDEQIIQILSAERAREALRKHGPKGWLEKIEADIAARAADDTKHGSNDPQVNETFTI